MPTLPVQRNKALNPLPRQSFVQHLFGTLKAPNDLKTRSSGFFMNHFFAISEISPAFTRVLGFDIPKFLQFGFPCSDGSNTYLLDIHLATRRVSNLKLSRGQLMDYLQQPSSTGMVSRGIPPFFISHLLCCIGHPNFGFSSYRFFHCVKPKTLTSIRNENSVPPFPEIYVQRVGVVPYFYSKISMVFPAEKLEHVYLPPLFLKAQKTKCKDASFQVSVVYESDFASYSNRVIYQMKQDPQADDCVNEMFAGKQYDRTTECEGLTFSESPTFRDPKHKCVRHYAFKVDEGPLRVLIKVNGTNLINRCLQTARLYMSILNELPSLSHFDVAIVINLNREPMEKFSPFVFRDTIASKIYERSTNKARSIASLRNKRSELSWFTEFCGPRGTYRAYAQGCYPQKKCMWIVDAKTF